MTSPMPFTGISHEELVIALKKVKEKFPKSEIYMVGTSFGGNYLLRYLINSTKQGFFRKMMNREEKKILESIKGFVGLAPPFDL